MPPATDDLIFVRIPSWISRAESPRKTACQAHESRGGRKRVEVSARRADEQQRGRPSPPPIPPPPPPRARARSRARFAGAPDLQEEEQEDVHRAEEGLGDDGLEERGAKADPEQPRDRHRRDRHARRHEARPPVERERRREDRREHRAEDAERVDPHLALVLLRDRLREHVGARLVSKTSSTNERRVQAHSRT